MVRDDGWHESFMVRMWAEPDGDEVKLRGSIQHVQSGRTTYFGAAELAAGLIKETAKRLTDGRRERIT